jgi:hypothetical protein
MALGLGWVESVSRGRSQDPGLAAREPGAAGRGCRGCRGCRGVEGEVELATRALGLEARRRAGEGSVLVTMDVRDLGPELLGKRAGLGPRGTTKNTHTLPCPALSCPALPTAHRAHSVYPTLALCLCRLGSGNCSLGRCHSSLEESSRGGMHAASAARQTTTARRPQGSLALWASGSGSLAVSGTLEARCAGVLCGCAGVCWCAGPGR